MGFSWSGVLYLCDHACCNSVPILLFRGHAVMGRIGEAVKLCMVLCVLLAQVVCCSGGNGLSIVWDVSACVEAAGRHSCKWLKGVTGAVGVAWVCGR